MREKIDYAALLEQRRAERDARRSEVLVDVPAGSPAYSTAYPVESHMVETRPAPEFTFDQWPPEGTPDVRPFDEYIATREGRCEHGYHLASQGCPKCGVASAEEVVEHFLNARR